MLSPVGPPGKDRPGVSKVTAAVLRWDLRRTVRRLAAAVRAVVAIAPDSFPFGACGERYKVYWVHDDYSSAPDLLGMSGDLLARGEQRLGDAADLIVACSDPLYERWRGGRARTLLIPNGCDDRLFATARTAPRPPDIELATPMACFVGRFTPRVDLAMLQAVADRGVPLLLLGSLDERFEPERLRTLLASPTVQYLGERDVRVRAGVRGSRGRGPRPVRGHRLQPEQLPAQDIGIPGCRHAGREHRPSGIALVPG